MPGDSLRHAMFTTTASVDIKKEQSVICLANGLQLGVY